jgi:hypothetical protein
MSFLKNDGRSCRRAKLRLNHIKRKICSKLRKPYSSNRIREYSVYPDAIGGIREEVSVVHPIRAEGKEEQD